LRKPIWPDNWAASPSSVTGAHVSEILTKIDTPKGGDTCARAGINTLREGGKVKFDMQAHVAAKALPET
jgi:hypothetical protein